MADVAIREVGPRDGLQAERVVAVADRVLLCRQLVSAGLADIEAVAFVSPKAVPAMAGAGAVVERLDPAVATWWALVPNHFGATLALAAGIDHLTLTVSASDQYSRKNVGRSTAEAIAELAHIAEVCAAESVQLDVVVSCCFGSPFDDVTDPEPVARVVAAVFDSVFATVPGARMTLADTTGTATPRRIRSVFDRLPTDALVDIGLHLHDTRGSALANALFAIDLGVRRFDTAVGGLGGSPFAPGAGGNLATEDLVMILEDLGVSTGVDLDAVIEIARSLHRVVGHPVPSRGSAAGPLARFR